MFLAGILGQGGSKVRQRRSANVVESFDCTDLPRAYMATKQKELSSPFPFTHDSVRYSALEPRPCLDREGVSVLAKSGIGTAPMPVSSKLMTVCSCPLGCCSRQSSKSSDGVERRMTRVRLTMAWQAGHNEIIRGSFETPGTR